MIPIDLTLALQQAMASACCQRDCILVRHNLAMTTIVLH